MNISADFVWRDWNPYWNCCPFCGLTVIDFEEEN